MRKSAYLLALPCFFSMLASGACSSSESTPSPNPQSEVDAGEGGVVDEDSGNNVPVDAGPDRVVPTLPKCDVAKPFGAPAPLPELGDVVGGSLTDDELTIVYVNDSVSDPGTLALFQARRATVGGSFGSITELSTVHSAGFRDNTPRISADGTKLYFSSNRPGGGGSAGSTHIWAATRASVTAAFGSASLLAIPAVSGAGAGEEFVLEEPFFSRDGKEFWFDRVTAGPVTQALWVAPVSGTSIGTPTQSPVSIGGFEGTPVLSADGLTLYFTSSTAFSGAQGALDIWKATRAATTGGFGSPSNVGELNSASNDRLNHISIDGCRAYLRSARAPAGLYVATRPQ